MIPASAHRARSAGVLLCAVAVLLGLAATGDAAREAGPTPLKGKVITIDPGHNGANATHASKINRTVNAGGGKRKACDTTGTETSDHKLTEAAFTFDVSKRVRAGLRKLGARVVMTRATNTGVGPCINERARIGNAAHSLAAISIHADGGPTTGRGFHVIRPGGVAGQSRRLLAASDLLGRRVRTALRGRGFKTASYVAVNGLDRRTDLGGLNLSRVPKVLVELGNMRNAKDAALLKSQAHRQRMADAIVAAMRIQVTH